MNFNLLSVSATVLHEEGFGIDICRLALRATRPGTTELATFGGVSIITGTMSSLKHKKKLIKYKAPLFRLIVSAFRKINISFFNFLSFNSFFACDSNLRGSLNKFPDFFSYGHFY